MRLPGFSVTRGLVELALGYSSNAGVKAPQLTFDLSPELEELGATPLAERERPLAAGQVLDSFAWCADRFPLGLREADGREVCAIAKICIGRSAHPGEYLTASSPHRPYVVFVAASWPLSNGHRLSSLLVHEAIHQGLYNREREEPIARPRSLAYSPWKESLRPGRLVCHAFWTFSIQFLFLGEAVLKEGARIAASDGKVFDFLAEMEVRIECCARSLRDFAILDSAQEVRLRGALAAVRRAGLALEACAPDYVASREQWVKTQADELRAWSDQELAIAAAG